MRQIYLDYNATTPIAPSVLEAMNPFLTGHYGNPSSAHSLGRGAKEAIEDARAKVSNVLQCDADEIVFTSGGSESNNLAIKGTMFRFKPENAHMVISSIEHPAVAEPAEFLKRIGYGLTVIGCDADGVIDPDELEAALQSNTRLVSVMLANNEIGTVQPVGEIARICHQRGILVHTDAAQAIGKVPSFVQDLDVDMLSMAGHKFYAPKGVGALYVRRGLELESLVHGASHENGFRAGTENTPYLVGFGQAAVLAAKGLDESSLAIAKLRDRFFKQLAESIPGLTINGGEADRLPNTLSVAFPGVVGRDILNRTTEVCASTGSACHSTGQIQSVTLNSMGATESCVRGTVRFSLGWYTSQEEIDRATSLIIDAWENLNSAG